MCFLENLLIISGLSTANIHLLHYCHFKNKYNLLKQVDKHCCLIVVMVFQHI